jgi:hypothetical protein
LLDLEHVLSRGCRPDGPEMRTHVSGHPGVSLV